MWSLLKKLPSPIKSGNKKSSGPTDEQKERAIAAASNRIVDPLENWTRPDREECPLCCLKLPFDEDETFYRVCCGSTVRLDAAAIALSFCSSVGPELFLPPLLIGDGNFFRRLHMISFSVRRYNMRIQITQQKQVGTNPSYRWAWKALWRWRSGD